MNNSVETESNPYLALRDAKIARNEARLKELGLWKQLPASRSTSGKRQHQKRTSAGAKVNKSTLVTPTRRSVRISGKDCFPDYKEYKLKDEKRQIPNLNRKDFTNIDDNLEDDKDKNIKSTTPSRPLQIAPLKANSVRLLSLHAEKLVQTFLGKPLEQTGKEFVINQAFRRAGTSQEVMQRLEGVRLSFNKYCGVQQWQNGFFLWVNMGESKENREAIVNVFCDDGQLITWFGGSRMYEDSPVIQSLLQLGKGAAKNDKESVESGIILWCRKYEVETKKLSSYTCLGRLGYHTHIPGSYPVAFTWRLLDYKTLIQSADCREVFHNIVNS